MEVNVVSQVIKEESVSVDERSPCSSPDNQQQQQHQQHQQNQQQQQSPNMITTPAGGKENRSCSPLLVNNNNNNSNSSTPGEIILTRSRSKVLGSSKEKYHRRDRDRDRGLSESPKSMRSPSPSPPSGQNQNPVISKNPQHLSYNISRHLTPVPGPAGTLMNGDNSSTSSPPTANGNNNSSSTNSSVYATPENNSSRHVVKIKRFLGTLLHFGSEISVDVGDRVRSLVFNLLSGHLNIEEFHHSLQEVTNFPLRPFVLPFLRAHLPILQRDISHLARVAKQTPSCYIRSHESVLVETVGSSPAVEPCDIFQAGLDMRLSGKRKANESFYENGEHPTTSSTLDGSMTYTSTPKRHQVQQHHHVLGGGTGSSSSIFTSPPFFLGAPGSSSGTGNNSSSGSGSGDFREFYSSAASTYSLIGTPHSHHINSSSTGSSSNVHHGQSSTTPSSNSTSAGSKPEEEWKNIHVMLNLILSMVEKTKRALGILQNRHFHTNASGTLNTSSGTSSSSGGVDSAGNSGENNVHSSTASSWLRRPGGVNNLFSNIETSDEFKRQASEMMSQALRATEDRVSEVKRRAEEAVQEVKMKALVELQRAVAAAELRANERIQMERALMDQHSRSRSAGRGPEPIGNSPEAECWNCGRKALETCSGCNMARYCSAFCQHKDWENHHSSCGRPNNLNNSSSTSSIVSSEKERSSFCTSAGPVCQNQNSAQKNLAVNEKNPSSPTSPINVVSQPSPATTAATVEDPPRSRSP